jgi:NAD(P)-dependent dehydrogenase (short-subunit alcohol dehydrogenase family)
MDVANYDDMKRFLDDAEEFGNGKLDIVVNAAGIVDTDSFMGLKVDQFKKLLDVNVIGVSNAAQVAIEKMKPHNDGKIVIVASIAGREGLEILSHYCATKAAAISLTQSAAKVAAHNNINVNAIAPGIIRTKMWEEILDGVAPEGADRDEVFDGFIESMIPLNRPQTEQDIANTVLFLCSDLASEITGQTINIDGRAVMS